MNMTQLRESHDDASLSATWSDAPKLSQKIRELGQRSYCAFKAGSLPLAGDQAISRAAAHELQDLRDQVARLQRKVHARKLNGLIPWVDALRQQVDDRLGHGECGTAEAGA
jgi:hypothetical protein